MSPRYLRCRNLGCPVPHGTVLGRLTADGGLVLDPAAKSFRVFLDTRRAVVACPACGIERECRGIAIFSDRPDGSERAKGGSGGAPSPLPQPLITAWRAACRRYGYGRRS